MQINEFDDVMGCIPTEDIVEGRFVLLCDQSFTHDFGSQEDLVGVRLPDNADDAARCRFIITWAVTNLPTPILVPQPSLAAGGRRGGWSQAANTPVVGSTIYLTYPGYTDCQTIPSGTPSLVYTEGTFTLPLGCYVADANIIVPGAAIKVSSNGADAGKPEYSATKVEGVIGYTERYDSTTGALTVKVTE
jgi:hypothetical protein